MFIYFFILGDVNNDTFADIIIGAPNAGDKYGGEAYVIYGRPNITSNAIKTSSLSVGEGFTVGGADALDSFGLSVSGAG